MSTQDGGVRIGITGGRGGTGSAPFPRIVEEFYPQRAPILTEREKTYGSFNANANYAQVLKEIFYNSPHFSELCSEHKESLDMIASKLARILSGGSQHKDNWLDISGYSLLALEACKREKDVTDGVKLETG